MSHASVATVTIVAVLFALVTLTGFAAVRWRRAEDMLQLNEWGLGGRNFGTFISWFLMGGDLYTAYTFIAVPALVYASGSIGFYAVSYTIMAFPIAFVFLPRLWSVSRAHDYITPADFIRGRYGSRGLALANAITGILATMPYVALQLVGIQAVLTVMGVGTTSTSSWIKDLPLFIAFAVLAIYTYVSGLRAPASIAFIKDALVYVFVIVAVFYIPARLGGWEHIFGVAQAHFASTNPATGKPFGTFVPSTKKIGSTQFDFATLALGSALALFIYPHAVTGVLATKSRGTLKRNLTLLPIWSVLLALIALFGYMALADPGTAGEVRKSGNPQLAVPYLLQHMFPAWFTGIAFAAIIIGALVPAAIMSIGAANLFTRNIFKEYVRPSASPRLETRVSQWASLALKFGALLFAIELPHTFSINLQLLGGIWILQTFPMLVGGLFTRWFHRWALLPAWLAGMIYGTLAVYNTSSPKASHWAASSDIVFGVSIYIGISAFIINLAIAVMLTLVLKAFKVAEGTDETVRHQYTAAESAPAPVPAEAGTAPAPQPASRTGSWTPPLGEPPLVGGPRLPADDAPAGPGPEVRQHEQSPEAEGADRG